MRPTLVCAFLALSLLPFGSALKAVEVEGLYRAEVPAKSRDASARAEGLRAALGLALKRLLRPADLASKAARGVLAKPEDYLLEYEYAALGEAPNAPQVLRAEFDPARLNSALRKGGIEVWSAERPELLVWLALKDPQGKWSAATERLPEAERTLGELSTAIGLPFSLPLWDLADEQALPVESLDSADSARIRIAAQRYETDTILAGRLVQAGSGWQADWRLVQDRTEQRWQSKAANLRDILASGLDGAAGRVAEQSMPRGVAVPVALKVIDIESLDDANRAAAYLERLALVAHVEWQGVGSGEASFKVTARGGRDALRRTLNLGRWLRPAEGEGGDSSGPLTYRVVK